MNRLTNRPHRRWQQVARSIPNRAKEAERRQDLERFHAEVSDEKSWLVARLDEVDVLISELSQEMERIQESLDRPHRVATSHLSPLTNAGKQHLWRKRMLRHAASLDTVLGEIHRHPVFRDIVAEMGHLDVPEVTLPAEEKDPFILSRTLMPMLEQIHRLLDGLYRLRRRMRRELLRLAR